MRMKIKFAEIKMSKLNLIFWSDTNQFSKVVRNKPVALGPRRRRRRSRTLWDAQASKHMLRRTHIPTYTRETNTDTRQRP